MRIRSIRPEFWSSEDIAALSWDARLIYIGLWSYVDDNGVGRDVEPLITAALFALEDSFTEASLRTHGALMQLHAGGQISRYTVAGKPFLHVTAFDVHQKINRPTPGRYPLPTSTDAVLTEPLSESSLSPHVNAPLGEGEKGRRGEVLLFDASNDDDKDDDDPSDLFADFYDAYPRHEAKRAAEKAYRAAVKRADHDTIMAGLARHQFSDDRKFVPLPASWLNADRWADEPNNARAIRPNDPHAGMTRQIQVKETGRWREVDPDEVTYGMHTEWRPAL